MASPLMCRADVSAAAARPLARVLLDIRDALAAQIGADPAQIRIGPVDLGPPPEFAHTLEAAQ